jgi:hypothetical protein
MRCDTRDEIAERENLATGTVSDIWSEFPDLEKLTKSDKAHADEEVLTKAAELPESSKRTLLPKFRSVASSEHQSRAGAAYNQMSQ